MRQFSAGQASRRPCGRVNATGRSAATTGAGVPPAWRCRLAGFTLIELLVVISILGILAALSVPALKNIGKSNIAISGSRQLLDDLARARQLAMSQRTTVYMVFVPTNFWGGGLPSSIALTNLADKQLTGYTFMSLRSVGDQPGRSTAHYLAPWQNLPDGTFIAAQKFIQPAFTPPFYISQWNSTVPIYGFNVANDFPFPTETNAAPPNLFLPFVAFNYLGQLTTNGQTLASLDEYIPLAQGSVSPAINPATKSYVLTSPASVTENPPGNSTNLYNIVHIDALTGRAVLEFQKVQ